MAQELKLSCLNLVEQGSTGLMGAIDHLRWLLAEVKEREERNAVIQEAADTFMEVQRAIMKRLMSSYDPVADQTVFFKFFIIFMPTMDSSMRSFFANCRETSSGKYSIAEIKQIMVLWRHLSRNLILWSFGYFLKFLMDVCFYYSVWKRILANCMSFRPAVSAFAVRWYLPTLHHFALWNCPENIPLRYHHIPNVMRIMIKSTAYLVNCWCLLDQADLAVVSEIMKKEVINLLLVLFWLMEFVQWKNDDFHHGELGRLLRCVISVIVKTANSSRIMQPLIHIVKPLTHCLKKTGEMTLRLFSRGCSEYEYVGKIVNVLPLLSRAEMGVFQDNFQHEMRKCSEAGHSLDKHKSIEEHCMWAMQMEEHLTSLSREDANIVFLPDHVNKAIDSLPHEATTFIPEVGVFTLLHRNKDRLQSLEWAQDILSLFDRAVEVEPILREILK